jgi:hypothetical protein
MQLQIHQKLTSIMQWMGAARVLLEKYLTVGEAISTDYC